MIRSHGCLNWCSFEVDCNLKVYGWLVGCLWSIWLCGNPEVDGPVQHILIKARILKTRETYYSIQRMEEVI